MLFYQKTPEETLKDVSSSYNGLSRSEVAFRLEKYGPNEIKIKGTPLWRKLAEPFASVFMAVLLVAVVISMLHQSYFDALIIVVIMLASAVIYYVQSFSTERILKSLQKKSNQVVDVTRGGDMHKVDATQLVPGDIIHLSEGDKIPADIRLLQIDGLRTDESVLTGESVPISKVTEAQKGEKEVYEQKCIAFQGSFVVAGQATGVVIFTGNNSEFGKIAALAKKQSSGASSPVQNKIDKLISYIIAAVGGIAVVAFGLALYRGIEVTEALRFVIALSVSAVPESLPVAISVVLVFGMRRMAAKKALVRSMSAIETIGVITTIATDKTGTLTKNQLSVQETWHPSWSPHHLPTIINKSINQHGEISKDPLDIALVDFANAEDSIELKGKPVKRLPFDQSFAMSGNIWVHKGKHELFVKGAPEQIMMRCNLTRAQMSEINGAVNSLTSQGYRVIALATSSIDEPIDGFHQLHKKHLLEFSGLVAVADTLRPSARAAIAAANRAGVVVRMITGDHFETAYSIGCKLGLVESRDQVFDSRLMIDMTDKQLEKVAKNARVFSRVTPENKYRILKVLKLSEVTAMTGDGVNDVPALASADVGIAMGSGSEIAKDAGDIILLNNDFASIVRAMREGRIIFANIRRMLFYLLSTNIGEVLTTLGALVVGMPMPLVPVQILWVNLVTDTTMVIPIGFEPGKKSSIMKQKPIKPDAPIIDKYMISRIIIVALFMCLLSLGLYAIYSNKYGSEYGQTIAFVSIVVIQWANALNARSTYESVFERVKVWHGSFWVGMALAVFLQWLALFGPLQELLHVAPVAIGDMFIVTLLSFILPIALIELHKLYGREFILKKEVNNNSI